jgi:DNA modification methylase
MAELIWDGKYVDGKRQGPVRVWLPFQTVETVNESSADRARTMQLFSSGRATEWRNRLIWGDKKYVLPSLLPDFAGRVNLIYIDPPFDTGADFSFTATIPKHDDSQDGETMSFTKEPSILEQKAYRDTWGRGLDSYLVWFYETAVLLHELLHDSGSLYVHLDWHVGHYAKIILDDVFGQENFRNELIWHYPGREMHIANKFNAKHDVILFFAKSDTAKIDMSRVAIPYDKEERLKGLRRKVHREADGREWVWETRGQASGQKPYKRYVDEIISQGRPLSDVWDDLQFLRGNHPERVDYATQKPSWLVERIIKASSSEGDLVLDCFCGSGTTAVVAERLGRRWIACDLGRFAIHTTRKRLLAIPHVRPFVVQNLGKYERQAWQAAEFRGRGTDAVEEQSERDAAYRKFILDLYHATPVTGHSWLHGMKSGRMIHVGAVDAPVTLIDVKSIAREVWKAAAGAGAKAAADILGWEFAFELNETAVQTAAEARVDVAFKKIPREVLEKKAVEQGDIKFFELGALSVEPKQNKRELIVKLSDFVIPIDDVPEEARQAIKHWSQMIDYWAVDWDFKGDTFHNEWQSYRTRQEPKLELTAKHEYKAPGSYTVVVKVIDILGNDTTKTLEVKVK